MGNDQRRALPSGLPGTNGGNGMFFESIGAEDQEGAGPGDVAQTVGHGSKPQAAAKPLVDRLLPGAAKVVDMVARERPSCQLLGQIVLFIGQHAPAHHRNRVPAGLLRGLFQGLLPQLSKPRPRYMAPTRPGRCERRPV